MHHPPVVAETLDETGTGKYRISEFKYETYPVPEETLKGKQQVRVKFVAKPHRQIGEIYEVRLVK